MRSEDLYERSLKVSPGGVHSPVRAFKSVGGSPLFFKGGQGPKITSVDGDEYVDFCQSFGPNLLGHRDPEVAHVVRECQEEVWSLGTCEPYSLELAEWVVEHVEPVEKIRFVNSGTEAVMSSLRVARAATGRSRVLKFEGCYHGHVDAMLVKAGSGLAGEGASDSAGVSDGVASQTVVAPLDDEEAVTRLMDEYGSELAAVILEPLPANFGLLVQRKEFLHHVFNEAKRVGALVIFDEVISGFRVALGGMAKELQYKPDLVTYGKVIGGGFPVGAYGGRADLMDLVAPLGPVYQAGTLAANPMGMRAGLATLKKVKREGIHQQLEEKTEWFVNRLNEELGPFSAARYGSLFWIHRSHGSPLRSLNDFAADHAATYKTFFHSCLQKGIFLAPSSYEVSFMSQAHDEALLTEVLDGMQAAAKEVHVSS